MSSGALEVLAKLFPVAPERLREARILNRAQDMIPEYFFQAIRRGAASVAHQGSTAEDTERAWHALLDDLEIEMGRREQ